jgi:stalled ribosome alternative rescue factor ArfA
MIILDSPKDNASDHQKCNLSSQAEFGLFGVDHSRETIEDEATRNVLHHHVFRNNIDEIRRHATEGFTSTQKFTSEKVK